MTQKTSSLLCVLLLAACGGSSNPGTDAATPGNDAATVDSGHEEHDGGGDVDAFVEGDEDAAVVDVDAFVEVPDCEPHTFAVTANGGAYQFDGGPNDPTLSLCAGVTYTFDMSEVSTSHPLQLLDGTTQLIEFDGGTTGEYTVPVEGPQPDSYDCTLHHFGGDITIVTP